MPKYTVPNDEQKKKLAPGRGSSLYLTNCQSTSLFAKSASHSP